MDGLFGSGTDDDGARFLIFSTYITAAPNDDDKKTNLLRFFGDGSWRRRHWARLKARCPNARHADYARRHGYAYRFFADDDDGEWERERTRHRLGLGWYKIYVLRRLLAVAVANNNNNNHHRTTWLVYVDLDAHFADASVALEEIVAQATRNRTTPSVILVDGVGWNAHVLFLRADSRYSQRLVETVWSVRDRLNDCLYEQCAVHWALLQALWHQHAVNQTSYFNQTFSVVADDHIYFNQTFFVAPDRKRSCCGDDVPLLRSHGLTNDPALQGCVWNWQRALRVLHDNHHPHIFWSRPLFRKLNLYHPDRRWVCDRLLLDTRVPVSRLPPAPVAPWSSSGGEKKNASLLEWPNIRVFRRHDDGPQQNHQHECILQVPAI